MLQCIEEKRAKILGSTLRQFRDLSFMLVQTKLEKPIFYIAIFQTRATAQIFAWFRSYTDRPIGTLGLKPQSYADVHERQVIAGTVVQL